MADGYINPLIDVVRSDEEIEAVMSRSFQTDYWGLTYEQGVRAMYEWLVGETDSLPIDLN